jgi:hypothetical protein
MRRESENTDTHGAFWIAKGPSGIVVRSLVEFVRNFTA